ncbi:hypothetical protein GCM10010346_33840 [Streptomyces chryseus]|uniref:Uncharacterized protein n=1 Tax=Streptomyces chryseus TaxID=68186 RepID=A0ABQ3DPU1_9ACTN|nr:hypothetical protein GCM10010346_33840 [Streptomyces chryseus]
MPDEDLARLREAHLAAGTDEEGSARGLFEGLHLLTDGGLGAAEFARGGGEGAGGGDCAQDAEMTGFDHTPSISDAWM